MRLGIGIGVGDVRNHVGRVAGRGVDGNVFVEPFAQQGAGERGVDADPVLVGVGFVVAHDADRQLLAIFILERDIGTEVYP